MSIRFQLSHDRALKARCPRNTGLEGVALYACNMVRAAVLSRESWRRQVNQAQQAEFFGGEKVAAEMRAAARERRNVMRLAALFARQLAGQISAQDPRLRKAVA